jgi:uncharacterized protein DUF4124
MRAIPATIASALAFAIGPPLACADVYTWTDAKGVLNVSNLAPPDDARVEKVVHDVARAVVPPPAPVPVPVPDPLAQAEVQTLAMRVRQLEYEVDLARRQAPAPFEYASLPPPPVMQYSAEPPLQPYYGCDPSWFGCSGFAFGGYPAGVVVLTAPNVRRHNPFRKPHHPIAMQRTHPPGDPIGMQWTTHPLGDPIAMQRTTHPPAGRRR